VAFSNSSRRPCVVKQRATPFYGLRKVRKLGFPRLEFGKQPRIPATNLLDNVAKPKTTLFALEAKFKIADQVLMRDGERSFHELADEAIADLLKKHKQPVGLKEALKESGARRPRVAKR
jgi:hypothetical protein